ncbi:MAG: signal peptide peptidase SppA [Clostridium sp.]|nr:signal peptide peptidase SppA [Clostridium sp.]
MLKRFFISMLGTMAGFWLSIIILGFVLVVGLVASLAKAIGSSADITPTEGILYLNLTGSIPERPAQFDIYDVLNGNDLASECLSDIVSSIRIAAKDKKIKAIYINCNGASMGIASRSEVVEALKEFKTSGKKIYAYADSYEQGDYYMASLADVVYLNPVGSLNVHGIGVQTIFFTGLLEKLGVEVQVVKVGSFKSAVEPFIRTSMSEPSKLQTSIYVNQLWGCMASEIAKARGVDASQVDMWADSLSFTWAPEVYVDRKMVSELKYRSEVEDELRERLDIDKDDKLPLVTPSNYLKVKGSKASGKKHVAVLYAVGDIVDSGTEGIVDDLLVPEIAKLADNDKVAGLVLRVNSGGGSAFASEQIWHALEKFKETGKPFYVSMGDYAASGGYYISCGADRIYADPTTLTGSIGIFGMIPNAHVLLTDKLGLAFETVASSPNANFPTFTEPGTERQLAAMQSYVERGYETFTSRVAAGRHIPQDSVKAIGGGRVWDGVSALKIGLVDELGTLNDAVKAMAKELDIDADRYACYPSIEDDWKKVLFGGLNSVEYGSAESLSEFVRMKKFAESIKNMNPVQARMEYILVE